MPRNRLIHPGLFTDPELYEAEARTGLPLRLAYTGLSCVADREGRFKWEPRVIKLDVLPYDPVDFAAALDALEADGFIRAYEVDGRKYGHIPNFLKYQKPHERESASRIPPPPSNRQAGEGEPKASPGRAQGEPKARPGSTQGKPKARQRSARGARSTVSNDGLRFVDEQSSSPPLGGDAADANHVATPKALLTSSGSPHGGWPAEFATMLEPIGQFAPGRIGKAIGPVVKRYGFERAREMLAAFVHLGPHQRADGTFDRAVQAHQFCTPERFAQTAGFWAEQTEPIPESVNL